MAKKKNNTFLIIGLLALLGVLVFLGIKKSKSKPKGISIELEEVKKRTIKETVTGSGKVFPEIEVKISSDVSGEIVNLYIQEGDSVTVGQVLAKIDPDAYVSAVERGEAALNNAKANSAVSRSQIQSNIAQREQTLANLENAKNVHERNIKLFNEGVISQVEFDQTLSNLKGLEANLKSIDATISSSREGAKGSDFNVKSAEASLKELRTNLGRTTIKSPVNGIVSSLSVEQGERVVGTMQMAGTEMMRIANLKSMEVQVEISENDILKVQLKDEVDVEVDAYLDVKFKGFVTEIANSASNISALGQSLSSDQVTNFIVKIRIDPDSYKDIVSNGNYPFRPGMSASVDIYTSKVEDVLTVPIQSVTARLEDEDDEEAEPKEAIFVYSADTVALKFLTTGIQNDEFIHVLSGLEEGEEIVVGPYSAISKKLKDGSAVQIKDKNGKKEKDEEKDESED